LKNNSGVATAAGFEEQASKIPDGGLLPQAMAEGPSGESRWQYQF
jgi:hypothetical protein